MVIELGEVVVVLEMVVELGEVVVVLEMVVVLVIGNVFVQSNGVYGIYASLCSRHHHSVAKPAYVRVFEPCYPSAVS